MRDLKEFFHDMIRRMQTMMTTASKLNVVIPLHFIAEIITKF
jgi:hypothetical protein